MKNFLLFLALITVSRSQPFEPFPTKWILELVTPSKEAVPNLERLLEDMSNPHVWELKPYSHEPKAWNFEIRIPTTWTVDPRKLTQRSKNKDGFKIEFFLELGGELGTLKTSHNLKHLKSKVPFKFDLDVLKPVTFKQYHNNKVSLEFSVRQIESKQKFL